MRKIVVLTLTLAFILVSCDDQDMSNETISPLVGTWEGENDDLRAKWIFDKNGNVIWDYESKTFFDKWLFTGTYKDNGSSFTMYSDEKSDLKTESKGTKQDYQINDDGFLLIRYSQSKVNPVHHQKID